MTYETIESEIHYKEAGERMDALKVLQDKLLAVCGEASALKIAGKLQQGDTTLPGVNDELENIRFIRKEIEEAMREYVAGQRNVHAIYQGSCIA